jgi:hypothetical protein
MALMSVLFPAPFSPNKDKTSPDLMFSDTLSMAFRLVPFGPLKVTTRLEIWMMSLFVIVAPFVLIADSIGQLSGTGALTSGSKCHDVKMTNVTN